MFVSANESSVILLYCSLYKVLQALQDAVMNHNLAVHPSPPPPESAPSTVTPVRNNIRQLPVHTFQVGLA